MLFVTGDCHGNFERFNNKNFNYDGCSPDKDYIVICGDFGGIFYSRPNCELTSEEAYWLNWLSLKPVTFVIVLGNHENYEYIENTYPVVTWNGGRVRKIKPNIVCVERGEVLELNGKKCWFFAGARSEDRAYRTAGVSWWFREEATIEEFDYGLTTFTENRMELDYIFTHEGPEYAIHSFIMARLYKPWAFEDPSETQKFFTKIHQMKNTNIKWFFGHHHLDFDLDDNLYCCYHDIRKLED